MHVATREHKMLKKYVMLGANTLKWTTLYLYTNLNESGLKCLTDFEFCV